MVKNIATYLKLIRVKHWVKNLFICLPLFFSGSLLNFSLLTDTVIAFILFSLCASSIYIVNDILDISYDREHPEKKNRPIASGTISISNALIYAVSIALPALIITLFFNVYLFYVLLIYVGLNISYSAYLKHIVVLDVVIVSFGFLLRIIAGSVTTHIILSNWLIMMTFVLSLFLAFAKRRDDVLVYESGKMTRKVIEKYNKQFLDIIIFILSVIIVVVYFFYTASSVIIIRLGKYAFISTFFVLLGVLRYLYLTFKKQKSSSPVKLIYNDIYLQITLILWALLMAYLIYR